jgi:5-formyltetrahydrofolate cyclo-ligase
MNSDGSDSGVRDRVWDLLRAVARPDSRFHFDFAPMHPDFEGSDLAAERLLKEFARHPVRLAFSAPDGALREGRERLLRLGARLVVSTYCMRRGFRLLDPARIAPSDYAFAATLDGLERFGVPVSITEVSNLGRMDLLLTGAAAVAPNGVRFGRSYQYFDIEWGVLAELGVATERTPVAVLVHDVQLIGRKVAPQPGEAVADLIVTPTQVVRVADRAARPRTVGWDKNDPDEIEQMPVLLELQRARGLRR